MEMRPESNMYIAISGNDTDLDEKNIKHVDKVFNEILEGQCNVVSDIQHKDVIEIVYEIKIPMISDNGIIREFYESLEILLDELSEFEPHFTQFEKGDL